MITSTEFLEWDVRLALQLLSHLAPIYDLPFGQVYQGYARYVVENTVNRGI
jgi:hypothetical protein